MNDLEEHLDDLDASTPVRQLAAAVADRAPITSHRAAEYVGVRPAMEDKAVALYLHRDYASIAVPHDRTGAELARFNGSHPRREKGKTTYLVLPDDVLTKQFKAAVDLAVEMVEWRAAGPKATLGGRPHHQEKPLKICPSCHMQLPPNGTCAACA